MNQQTKEKIYPKKLTECIESLQKQRFLQNFMVNEKGLHGIDSEKKYSPEEIKILNFNRFEGENEPADSSILYAIEANDGQGFAL